MIGKAGKHPMARPTERGTLAGLAANGGPTHYKTEIRLEIWGPDGDLVAELREELLAALGRKTERLVQQHRGRLICFTTRSCAAIPDVSYAWGNPPTEGAKAPKEDA